MSKSATKERSSAYEIKRNIISYWRKSYEVERRLDQLVNDIQRGRIKTPNVVNHQLKEIRIELV